MKMQVFIFGAILTVLTGISAFVSNSVLWAPGFVVAFFINGGGHESHLGRTGMWSIAAVVNFMVYSGFSWVLILAASRIRGKKLEAGS
jgi:hypothetical protein